MRKSMRVLTVSLDHEPLWVRLYVYPLAEGWTAANLADGAPPPELSSLRGMAFVGKTSEDAQRLAVEYLDEGVSLIPIIPNTSHVSRVTAEKSLPPKQGAHGMGHLTMAKYHAAS